MQSGRLRNLAAITPDTARGLAQTLRPLAGSLQAWAALARLCSTQYSILRQGCHAAVTVVESVCSTTQQALRHGYRHSYDDVKPKPSEEKLDNPRDDNPHLLREAIIRPLRREVQQAAGRHVRDVQRVCIPPGAYDDVG